MTGPRDQHRPAPPRPDLEEIASATEYTGILPAQEGDQIPGEQDED